jgi:hypothetical protein
VIEGLNESTYASFVYRRDDRRIDAVSRCQIAIAAKLLRSIRPRDGEIEILLHEMARRLEQVAEGHEAEERGASVVKLGVPATARS